MEVEETVHWSVHVSREWKSSTGQTHIIFDNIKVDHAEFAKLMVQAFKSAGLHSYANRWATAKKTEFTSEQW